MVILLLLSAAHYLFRKTTSKPHSFHKTSRMSQLTQNKKGKRFLGSLSSNVDIKHLRMSVAHHRCLIFREGRSELVMRGSHFATDSRRRRLNNIWLSLGSGAGSLQARCHCQQWKNPVIVWSTRHFWVIQRLWLLTTLTPKPFALPSVTSYPRSRPGEPGSGSAAVSDRCCLLPLKKMMWEVRLLSCPVLCGNKNVAWTWWIMRPAQACSTFSHRWVRGTAVCTCNTLHIDFCMEFARLCVLQYRDSGTIADLNPSFWFCLQPLLHTLSEPRPSAVMAD